MKRLDSASDDELGRQIACTRQIWQPRMGRNLTDEEARQILHNATGFFNMLAEWQRADKLGAANDNSATVAPKDDEVRNDL